MAAITARHFLLITYAMFVFVNGFANYLINPLGSSLAGDSPP
jgi:hypothetical protein